MKILGKLLGSLVCAIAFGVIGFVAGLLFPWWPLDHDGYASTKPQPRPSNLN
jgi:hypothetical protein